VSTSVAIVRSEYRAAVGREVRSGALIGLVMAAFYCAYVIILYAVSGPAPFERHHTTLATVLASYAASGLFGGFVYGLLHPLRRALPGQLVVGTVIATLVVLNINIAREGPPTRWTGLEWEPVIVLGLLFGVVGTFAMRRTLSRP
jgi:Mg/Co/Ni transporter MgtE